MGRLLLLPEFAGDATAAPAGYVKVIIDYSGDAPAVVLIDENGNQTTLGGDGSGGGLPEAPPQEEGPQSFTLRLEVDTEGNPQLPAAWVQEMGVPMRGSQRTYGRFQESDLGRILQVQPWGDVEYVAVWSDLKFPVFSRVDGSENGAFASELPDEGAVLMFKAAGEGGGGDRIEWQLPFTASRSDAGVTSNFTFESAQQVGLTGVHAADASLNDRLNAIMAAAYSPFSHLAPVAIGEVFQVGDIVTQRVVAGIMKYFKADTDPGNDAVGVVVSWDLDLYEAIVYKGHGVVSNLVITGPDAAPGDHLYVSDTVPGTIMVGPPASGTKQYVGRAQQASAGGIMYSLDLNIQPQQAI